MREVISHWNGDYNILVYDNDKKIKLTKKQEWNLVHSGADLSDYEDVKQRLMIEDL